METVTATAAGAEGSISLSVPAGNDRFVEVIAVPVSGAPAFAVSYYGTATADLKEGEATGVTVKLSLGQSKLVLPDGFQSQMFFADSISSGVTGSLDVTPTGTWTFDGYGRLFLAEYGESAGTKLYTNLEDEPEIVGSSNVNALAYDAGRNRLYSLYNSEASYIRFTNLSDTEPEDTYVDPPLDYTYSYNVGGVAVDSDGDIYTGLMYMQEQTQLKGIGKLSVDGDGGESVSSTLMDFVPYAEIGLDVGQELYITDLYVRDGVLYALASEVIASNWSDNLYSRGKLVAIDASDLSKLWETGWTDDPVQFPSESEGDTHFYGPRRIVGVAPKKLYIGDEGFYWSGLKGSSLSNVDRVVVVDLETQTITDIGLEGAVGYFEDYEDFVVYGAYTATD